MRSTEEIGLKTNNMKEFDFLFYEDYSSLPEIKQEDNEKIKKYLKERFGV